MNRDNAAVTVSVKQTNSKTFTLSLPAHSMQTVILPASDDTKIFASFKRYYDQLRDPSFASVTTPLHVAVLNNDYNRVHRLINEVLTQTLPIR
ncbi:Glycoside hydrolase, family 30 [Phytophthora cactorum]|nr:Glycoside hydrolase, family 30 [Phytophthora cactorum]